MTADGERGGDDARGRAAAVRARVSGRVQGVGFRYFIVTEAQRLGLVGYARNLHDGDVEILAEGNAAALQQLIDAARRGPRWAHVDHVDVAKIAPSGRYDGFGVRY